MTERVPANLKDPKFIIAYTIIVGFAFAYYRDPDDTMKGALIAAFAGAWGYYLGSSNSSNHIRDQMDKALSLGLANAPERKPDAILKPGQTAQAEPLGDEEDVGEDFQEGNPSAGKKGRRKGNSEEDGSTDQD